MHLKGTISAQALPQSRMDKPMRCRMRYERWLSANRLALWHKLSLGQLEFEEEACRIIGLGITNQSSHATKSFVSIVKEMYLTI